MNGSCLELLDIYQEMVEKQGEIIRQLGKIVARQANDLQLLKNVREFSCMMEDDIATAEECIKQCENMKSELEP